MTKFTKLLSDLQIDNNFLKQYMAAKNDESSDYAKDRMLIDFGKKCKVPLKTLTKIIEETTFACPKYTESKYLKYKAINSLATGAACHLFCEFREAYQAGRVTDEEWIKFGRNA